MPLYYQDSIIQTAFSHITESASTSATSFSGNLLSLALTTGENAVIVQFSASCGNTSSNQYCEFQLVIDGTPRRGIAIYSASSGNGNSGALVYKTEPLAVGPHSFSIQWRVGGGIGSVAPATSVVDHASLFVQEVTV